MTIEKLTEKQIELGKKIIAELNKRPQMPIKILAGIVRTTEDEAQAIVDFLEYQGSIVKRVSRDFLQEAECLNIQLIHQEMARRLSEDQIKVLSISQLEDMLKAALSRKQQLEGGVPLGDISKDLKNSEYIEKLYNSNKTGSGKTS